MAVGLQTALTIAPAGALSAGWFQFDRYSNTNSNLFWFHSNDGRKSAQYWYYRAGSGSSTDECWVGKGWLPGGWYDLWGMWDNYNGGKIFGRVFRLSDHSCREGTRRA